MFNNFEIYRNVFSTLFCFPRTFITTMICRLNYMQCRNWMHSWHSVG